MKASFLLIIAILATTGHAVTAFAQEATIETSADNHDNRFFGEGVLRIVITDPDAESSDVEEISIEINAEPDSGSGDSVDIVVPETNGGSGRFELFLAHIDATFVGPADLDPDNSAGLEGDGSCTTDCAPFVTFGQGGEIDVEADLYDDISFEIRAGDSQITVNYEEDDADLELDRTSYGTTSFVYLSVIDQDANLNPTERDEFTVDPGSDPNADLFELAGGSLDSAIVFEETGDNSGVFEGRYRLGVSMTAESESLVITLHDKANYGENLGADENDSNVTVEVGFTVGNSGGSIDVGGVSVEPAWDPVIASDKESYLPGETVAVKITDYDANADENAADNVQILVVSGESIIEILAVEMGTNSGVFEADFMLAEGDAAGPDEIIPSGIVTIVYTDSRPADYSERVQAGMSPEKEFALEIDIQLPDKIGIEATNVTAPVPVDVSEGGLAAGYPVTLSTTVSNNNDEPQPFVALIEVRDGSGATVFLAWQGGTLEPSSSAEIAVLWQPSQAGTFEARTFVISNIWRGADVLSPVASSDITIS